MISSHTNTRASRTKMPRTCGDDPLGTTLEATEDENAPHLRG